MEDAKQWAEDHGEPHMTMRQLEADEARERQAEEDREALEDERQEANRSLEISYAFTADELDWLLGEVLPDAAPIHAERNQVSDAGNEVLYFLAHLKLEAERQGYRAKKEAE